MSALRLDGPAWHRAVAEIIGRLDEPELPATLVGALSRVVPFDHAVIFAYRGRERPIDLFDNFGPERRRVFVTDYQEGPYLLDPFYQVCADGIAPGLYRMRDLAPDRFYRSEYFRSYYRRTGLAEEIGFFVALADGVMVVISLMRAGTSACFSDGEMARLEVVEPVVRAAARRHWRLLGHDRPAAETGVASLDSHLATAFENFGRSILTARECEVVRLVLRGHSSDSIARRLAISPGTVKIHRKNIYAKLDVSSQSELFSLFIESLTSDAALSGSDPLASPLVGRRRVTA